MTLENIASFIPFHAPSIGEDEITEVVDTLRSGWLTTGPKTARFEEEFSRYSGGRHALALNSCTAGLHLALTALGIGSGDEVITTPNTFCATVSAILHTGATPVLADVGPDGNIDAAAVRERITPRTRAILPVHLAGLPCAMNEIWRLAGENGLFVVEDAAHALGALYRAHHPGSQKGSSDAVVFSFYATKNITTGEGGMVTANSDRLMERMRMLALHGMSRDAWRRYSAGGKWRYDVIEPGFKYNLSDLQSSLGIVQLRRIEEFVKARAAIAETYNAAFREMDEIETPRDCGYGRHAWHLYVLRLNLNRLAVSRDEFVEELNQRGVGTSVHFIPITMHSFFARWAADNPCPKAESDFARYLSLPLYPALEPAQIERVIQAVKATVAAVKKTAVAARGQGA